MAIEEASLGPRKTMFVLVVVVGCFAMLWPRILSPLLIGNTRDQLKPNKFDREAGCCEVMFQSDIIVLEVLNELCHSAVGADGKLSPYAAAQCRQTVNETCGLDIAAFLKKSDNVGKTTRMLLETMKSSNSSCLRENFGVPVYSLSIHTPVNAWLAKEDNIKQERSPIRGVGPHPALRERGRAIPTAPAPSRSTHTVMPPHVRVRSSPLSGYFQLEIDVKPPPIPGMRPPLGSPGGPVPAPKSSMGFVMPIYTICIIVFFVYTLSKLLFKRAGTVPYDQVSADAQFRRRVFRDDSRSSQDTKLGHKERDAIVTAISGLVAEVRQQMEASYTENQQTQDVQDNHTRPYTNGSVSHKEGPIRIIASEYIEPVKEESPEKETSPEPKEPTPEPKEPTPEPKEPTPEPKEPTPEIEEPEKLEAKHKSSNGVLKSTPGEKEDVKKATEEFLKEAVDAKAQEEKKKQTTPELLEEALQESEEEEEEKEEEEEPVESTVKVLGMETSAQSPDGCAWQAPPPAPRAPHEADDVKSIYLQTEIPQQSKVLVTDFREERGDKPKPPKHSPLVVSGKMTLSLIQDAPRETPERDAESTVDDFTTADAISQPAEKEDLSEEELEEDIEVEEIEEEMEEVEEVEEIEEEEDEEEEEVEKKAAK